MTKTVEAIYTNGHLEPVEPSERAPITRRISEKVSARIEGLRSVLASISIL